MAGLVLSVDPDGILAGAKQAKAALDTVVESARKTEAALIKAGQGGDQLKRKFDPAHAAALKLGNELDELDRALKTGAIDAKVYATEIGRMGQATNVASGGFKSFGGGLQNLGYQVNDFAVQVGAGTSATQALGQQLPQVLQAFGLWGVALSVVVSAGIPLAGVLFGSRDAAAAFGEATDFAADRLDAFRSALDNASLSADEMKFKFGEVSAEVEMAFDAIALQKADAAKRAIDAVSASLAAMFDKGAIGVADLFDVGGMRGFISGEARALTLEFRAQQEALSEADGDLNSQLAILTEMLATTQSLASANGSVSDAEQVFIDQISTALNQTAEQVALTRELQVATFDVGSALSSASDYMSALVSSAPGGGWLSGAIGDASALAGTLWDAASAAAAARGGVPMSDVKGGRGKSIGGPELDPYGFRAQLARDEATRKRGARAASKGGKGGGGGGGAADKTADEYERLIGKLDPATKAANDFADAQETINKALKAGAIDATEAARAMGLAKAEYSGGGEAAKFWKDTTKDLKDAFLDAAVTGVNSFEAIKNAIKRAALEALIFKTGPLAGMFGGGGGGFMSGLFGIGKNLFAGLFDAGGTIPTGQFGVVGEKGPEIVRSTNSGAVVTSRANTARQLSGGGGGTDVRVHVTTSIDNEGGIRNYVQTMGIQATQAAVGQVKGSLAGWSSQLNSDGVIA